jgi:hypothetical protein
MEDGGDIRKAFHVLEGILSGITVDNKIETRELSELIQWRDAHKERLHEHPFCRIVPFIDKTMTDGVLSTDEIEDLRWFIGQLTQCGPETKTLDVEFERFVGFLHGIISDGDISERETFELKKWFDEHSSGICDERLVELRKKIESGDNTTIIESIRDFLITQEKS